jgi:TIGR03009 family protein
VVQSPDRAIVRFEKREREKNLDHYIVHEEIICTGKHILQYAYPTRQIFVYPLSKEERRRTLEEGPLPFLFNVHAHDLEARFRLKLASETSQAYVIEVHPLLEHDQELFIGAHLWLNKQSFLPDKLRFYAPNGKDRKEYTFGAVQMNPTLDPQLFRGKRLDGWTIVENPGPGPVQTRGATRSARPAAR